MKQLRPSLLLFSILAVGIFLFCTHVRDQRHVQEIKDNLRIGDAQVTGVNTISRLHDWNVLYTYSAGGKTISYSRSVDANKYKKTDFLNRHFPVVYSAAHADISDILVNRDDSVKYGVGIK